MSSRMTYDIDLSPLGNLGACPLTSVLLRLQPLVFFPPEFVKGMANTEMVMPSYKQRLRRSSIIVHSRSHIPNLLGKSALTSSGYTFLCFRPTFSCTKLKTDICKSNRSVQKKSNNTWYRSKGYSISHGRPRL